MDQTALDDLLTKFAHSHRVGDLTPLAEQFLKEKAVNDARRDKRFREGLANCAAVLSSDASDSEKLKSLAIAYRLGAASKPVAGLVRDLVKPHLAHELPFLDSLEDGDERYYASLAVLDANEDWVIGFAARGIAREETAEKARSILARRIIPALPLSESLSRIAEELAALNFKTENPSESGARRLRRVIAAIRPAIVSEPMPPGDDLGKALKSFFTSPFSSRPAADSKATNHLAEECCGLVYDILRTQLSVVAEPSIYRSLSPAREWIGRGMWPRFIRNSGAGQRLVDSLESALVLLGKQNVTDQNLLETLELFVESRDAARQWAARIADNHPEIDDSVREWLGRYGRNRSTPILTSMSEARESSSDDTIASLLVTADSARRNPSSSTVEQMVADIETLASFRGLELRLEPNAIVEYAPSAHEMVGGRQDGVRKVRVIRPLVQRQNPDGVVAVIRKAMVEAVGDNDG